MASATRVPFMSVEEYLSTAFRPDVDYVDGYIEERNLGEMDHGTLQGVLFSIFFAKRNEWKLWPALDTRMQVAPGRFRVPDLSIVTLEGASEQIIRSAPVLCIEILSPEDTMRKMQVRIEDYFAMGVPNVWIFDPARRFVRVCGPGGVSTDQMNRQLALPGTHAVIELDEVFGSLDESKRYTL